MNLDQLSYYVAAVRRGSFSAASKVVFVTPAGVSKAISELEKELQVQLLVRNKSGLIATEFGNTFYEKALHILACANEIKTLAADYALTADGSLFVLAAQHDAYRGALVHEKKIRMAVDRFPESSPSLLFASESACISALINQTAQAIIGASAVMKDDVKSIDLGKSRIKIAVSDDHPLSRGKDICLDDVVKHPIARPYDLGKVYLAITSALRKCHSFSGYVDIFPSLEAHRSFLDCGGILFVVRSETLVDLYPNTVFLEIQEEVFSPHVFYSYHVGGKDDFHKKYSDTLACLIKSGYASGFLQVTCSEAPMKIRQLNWFAESLQKALVDETLQEKQEPVFIGEMVQQHVEQ